MCVGSLKSLGEEENRISVAGGGHIGDRAAGFLGSQVLQHFNAGHQVVMAARGAGGVR